MEMDDLLYLQLYKELITCYKEDIEICIEISHKEKHRFHLYDFVKISDIELEEDCFTADLSDGGELVVYKKDNVKNLVRRDIVYKDKYIIETDEMIVIIDVDTDTVAV